MTIRIARPAALLAVLVAVAAGAEAPPGDAPAPPAATLAVSAARLTAEPQRFWKGMQQTASGAQPVVQDEPPPPARSYLVVHVRLRGPARITIHNRPARRDVVLLGEDGEVAPRGLPFRLGGEAVFADLAETSWDLSKNPTRTHEDRILFVVDPRRVDGLRIRFAGQAPVALAPFLGR